MDNFNIARASVIGSEHIRLSLNNQDSLLAINENDYCIGIVSDGCGSSQHSEVGSTLMVRIALQAVLDCVDKRFTGHTQTDIEERFHLANQSIVNALYATTLDFASNWWKTVKGIDVDDVYDGVLTRDEILASCFLCTIVGFCICEEYTVVFSIGDGFYAVNGKLECLETEDAKNNAPAYIAYSLMSNVSNLIKPESLEFSIKVFPTKDIETIMVGTDGVRFLIDQDDVNIPGKNRKVGNVSQLWDDKMFANPDMMRRTLSLLNKDVHVPDWVGQSMIVCPSILKDDVAVISARRAK